LTLVHLVLLLTACIASWQTLRLCITAGRTSKYCFMDPASSVCDTCVAANAACKACERCCCCSGSHFQCLATQLQG